ncbi:MAG: DUF305 domain-containing protein [Vicinamibacterales bacterium]
MFQVSVFSRQGRQRRSGLRRVAGCAMVITAISVSAPGVAAHATQDPPAAVQSQQPYSEADVQFMAGMIPHHAQAVLIAQWAPSHGARPDLKILCERIVVAQRDEIATMQGWLRDRGQKVPDATSTKMRMTMNGMEHDMLMPGMLTDEQLAELDKARGATFDRLFLTAMIKHHQGAITMVEQLFAAFGAAQDDVVFRFASDVVADQSTEIERMEKMLAAVGGRPPQ